jgi:sugar transferase (PEP-CTERM/EpsH1 system associated)
MPLPPLVLHVIHHLQMGGMENGLVNLVNSIPSSKYRHAIACVEDYSDFRARITRPDVEVIALRRSQIGVWGLRRACYSLVRRLRPALIHTRNLSGLDALLPARLAGATRLIHSEHGWDVDNLDGAQWKPRILRRLHSPVVSRYITVSRHLAAYLTAEVGISPTRITQIYNGVDTARFQPKPDATGCLPAAFRGSQIIRIGTVGRIQAVKDQATLLRAFAALCALGTVERGRLRLVMAGDGPLLDDLKTLADSLGVADLVWLPGACDNIPEILAALDIFVLPSLNEGISNTILEAMASGLPAVVTEVGGNIELVDDGVCGRHFRPGDFVQLSQLLAAYVADEALRRAHGAAARATADARFSLATMVTRYTSVYDTALGHESSI